MKTDFIIFGGVVLYYLIYVLWCAAIYALIMQRLLLGKLKTELITACLSTLILSIGGFRPYLQIIAFFIVYIFMCLALFVMDFKYK